jgi:hypothetical protein
MNEFGNRKTEVHIAAKAGDESVNLGMFMFKILHYSSILSCLYAVNPV